MKRLIIPSLIGALVGLPTAALAASIDVTEAVAQDATVKVSNVAGEIRVTVWDRQEVHLTGDLGRNQELETTRTSGGIQFEVNNPAGDDRYDEAQLDLVVPVGASLIMEAISADVRVDGSRGDSVVAESVSGDIEVTAEVARIELSSVSGDVDFGGAARRAELETVSGDIGASGLTGEVSLSTVSGDARLQAGTLDRGQFETVSGLLELHLAVSDGGRLTIESMSGDVQLALPAGQQGEFNVQTFSGDIDSVLGQVARESFGPGSHLRHSEGGSGAQFRIESFSGDIRIERD